MTITRRLKGEVYLACLHKPQSVMQILEKVNKVNKNASYEDVSPHCYMFPISPPTNKGPLAW
jgi:hypothetical protein